MSYSANRNRVEQLVTATDSLQYGYLNYVIEGQPIGVFYGLGYERDANGEVVIDPATGLGELSSERRILGNPNPDSYGTLGNDFAIGDDIVLNVLLDGSFGNEVAKFTRRITEFFGADAVVGEEIERAIELKDDPSLQPISYTLNGDRIANYEEYVEDGSYMKVREVALRYTLPPSWLRRFGPEGVTLRLAARNLYTWTNYSGVDPETNLFAGNTVARGVDFAVTPLPRTVVFGATLEF